MLKFGLLAHRLAEQMGDLVNAAAEKVARTSYGRILAVLAARFRDIEAAEEALAEAFRKALENWPIKGVPDKPEAWLLTVSKNLMLDQKRSAASRYTHTLSLEQWEQVTVEEETMNQFGDEQLKLLFVCAHPAISESIHTPLMLQTVFGFDADTIGTAYMVPGATLAQRLVRAKRKIRDAGIAFSVPENPDLSNRLAGVLEAIYGAYSLRWTDLQEKDITRDMCLEATYLSDLLVQSLPDEAEVLGLAALLSFSMARREARYTSEGNFVPLEQQDVGLWDPLRIRRGNVLLNRAEELKTLGRFQIEAAIQSAHCERYHCGEVNWLAIAELYSGLSELAPTFGAIVGKASAFGQAFGSTAGLAVLETIDSKTVGRFQPFWATKAHLHEMEGDIPEAKRGYEKAIGLTTELPVRRYLEERFSRLR